LNFVLLNQLVLLALTDALICIVLPIASEPVAYRLVFVFCGTVCCCQCSSRRVR